MYAVVNEKFVAESSLQAHPPPECLPRPITIERLDGSVMEHIFEYFSCSELMILSCVCFLLRFLSPQIYTCTTFHIYNIDMKYKYA